MRLHTKDHRYGIIRGKNFIKIQIGRFRVYLSVIALKPKHESAKRRSFRREILKKCPACALCGTPLTIETLSVHHRISASERPDLVYDPENCVSLCARCHTELHRRENKMRSRSERIPVISPLTN